MSEVIDTRRNLGAVEFRVVLHVDDYPTDPRVDWDCDDEETIRQYLDGEVYGYVIERRCSSCQSWEQIESCWEFYGYDYAVESAREAFEHVLAPVAA